MNTTTDKTTLKNIKGRTAPFLLLNSGRPDIGPVQQSSIFSRVKNFLPELAQANEQLPADQPTEAIQIENVAAVEDTSSSSSDESDISSYSESVIDEDEKPNNSCVEIDVNLFKDPAPIEEGDHTIENVNELPEGFREEENSDEPKPKKIVEELS